DSWHHRLVVEANMPIPNRIWTYYIVYIPWALVMYVFGWVVVIFAYFFGYSSDFSKDSGRIFRDIYPHKMTKGGNRKLITPWEVVVCLFLGWFVVQVGFFVYANSVLVAGMLVYLTLYAGGVCFFVISPIYFLRRPLGRWAGRQPENFKKFWDQVCPELTVIKKEVK
ncbi:MAG: hypothetical protein AAB687_02530, partial [Patescibacteria group bacterium]